MLTQHCFETSFDQEEYGEMKKEFEEIPHSGGMITFSDGLSKYENSNPFPVVLYEILVSMQGEILGRGDFGRSQATVPSIPVMIGSDREGCFGYACPECKKYFRAAYAPTNIACPYCLYLANALLYLTDNQKQYIQLYYRKSLEHYQTGKKLEINLNAIVDELENNIVRLNNSEIRQQLTIKCNNCKTKLDVIGVYASCPRCGTRNNFDVFFNAMLEIREQVTSSKINTNDALNRAVEAYAGAGSDVKFIFEKNLSFIQLEPKAIKKIDFQKIIETNDILINAKLNLFPAESRAFLHLMFQRRHIIAHRSGIVDLKYLDSTQDSSVRLGQKISIDRGDLLRFFDLLENCTQSFFSSFNLILIEHLKKSKR